MAINVVPGITHTVFVDDLGVTKPSCVGIVDVPGVSLLNLRTMPVQSQILSLNGRTSVTNIDFSKVSLLDYQMRRKAETLQYRTNQQNYSVSKKIQYSNAAKATGGSYYYSNKDLITKITENLNCSNLDMIVRPPTNSGVHDYKFPGYFYNVSIKYLPNL
jgi:hypothetical protein